MSNLSTHSSLILRGRSLGNINTDPIATGLSMEAKIGTGATPIYAQVQSRINQLPPDVKSALVNGEIFVRPINLYAIKDGGDKNIIDMFSSTDAKVTGITNVNKGELDAKANFLLTGLRVLVSDAVDGDFSPVLPKELKNAEFTLKIGENTFLNHTPMTSFRETATETQDTGTFVLGAPRFLPSQTRFDLQFHLGKDANGATAALTAGTHIRVEFLGAMIS